MRPAARQALPAGEAPRCLRVRAVEVWGEHPGDAQAPARWTAAATTWRAAAHAAGVPSPEVWAACPAGRFLVGRDRARLRWLLDRVGATEDDVDAIADEARRLWPALFTAAEPTASREDANWHLRELQAQRATGSA